MSAPGTPARGEIESSRTFDYPRERVFAAFIDPAVLATWWGPAGFTNTFKAFEPRAGGDWWLVMQAPEGPSFDLRKKFVEVVPPERVVLDHLDPVHGFRMVMSYEDLGWRTLLSWRMRFNDSGEADRVRDAILQANEQNFDRLEEALARKG